MSKLRSRILERRKINALIQRKTLETSFMNEIIIEEIEQEA